MNFYILLLIFVLLIAGDKGLTAVNLSIVKDKSPNANPYQIEKNPLARFIFEKIGIAIGSIIYGLISLVTLFIAYFLFKQIFGETIALIIILILYTLVIINNFIWMLKYMGELV